MLAVFTVKEKCAVVKKAGCAVSEYLGCLPKLPDEFIRNKERDAYISNFLVFTLEDLEEDFQQHAGKD